MTQPKPNQHNSEWTFPSGSDSVWIDNRAKRRFFFFRPRRRLVTKFVVVVVVVVVVWGREGIRSRVDLLGILYDRWRWRGMWCAHFRPSLFLIFFGICAVSIEWYGIEWYGMVWYSIELLAFVCFRILITRSCFVSFHFVSGMASVLFQIPVLYCIAL